MGRPTYYATHVEHAALKSAADYQHFAEKLEEFDPTKRNRDFIYT